MTGDDSGQPGLAAVQVGADRDPTTAADSHPLVAISEPGDRLATAQVDDFHALAEAVTRVSDGVPAPVFAEASGQFTEKELVDLTWAIAAINAWNRIAISFRAVPGKYQSPGAAH